MGLSMPDSRRPRLVVDFSAKEPAAPTRPRLEVDFTQQPRSPVYDGDTQYVDGERSRSRGINAPELESERGAYEAGGYPAKRRYEELLASGEYQPQERGVDKFGRPLIKQVDKEGRSIEAQLVREGYAAPFMAEAEPDVRRARDELADAFYLGEMPEGTVARMREAKPAAPVTHDPRSWGARAKDRGIDNLQATGGAFLEATGELLGIEGLESTGREIKTRNVREAAESPADVESWRDVQKDPTKALKYIGERVVEQLPQLGVDLAVGAGAALAAPATGGASLAAIAGRQAMRQALKSGMERTAAQQLGRQVAGQTARGFSQKRFLQGVTAAMYPQMVGESYMGMQANGVEEMAAASTAMFITGPVNTALERFGFDRLLSAIKVGGPGSVKRVQDILTASFAAAGKQAPVEGLTEVAQQITTELATIAHRPEHEINREELLEGFFAGMAAGGGLAFGGRGLTATLDYFSNSRAATDQNEDTRSDGTRIDQIDPASGTVTRDGETTGVPSQFTPEPEQDVRQQARDLADPEVSREAVVAHPDNAPAIEDELQRTGAEYEVTPTADGNVTFAAPGAGVETGSNAANQQALGYTENLDDVANDPDAVVVQAVTPEGAVRKEQAVTAARATDVQEQMATEYPDSEIRVVTPEQVHERRAAEAPPVDLYEQDPEAQAASDDFDRFVGGRTGIVTPPEASGVTDRGDERGDRAPVGDRGREAAPAGDIRQRIKRIGGDVRRVSSEGGDSTGPDPVAVGEGPGAEGAGPPVRTLQGSGSTRRAGRATSILSGALDRAERGEANARIAQTEINQLAEAARRGDEEALRVQERAEEILSEHNDVLGPHEALAIAVQEIRTDERVTDQESSLRSTSDPDVVEPAIAEREVAQDEAAIERAASAFEELPAEFGVTNTLFGDAFKEAVAVLEARHPTFTFRVEQRRRPDGRVRPQVVGRDFKRYSSVSSAEQAAVQYEQLYPDSVFTPYELDGDVILVETDKPQELRAEVHGESAAVNRMLPKIRKNAGTALRMAEGLRKRGEVKRADQQYSRLVAMDSPEGERVYLHAPTITELGQMINGNEGDSDQVLAGELMLFNTGLGALVNRGFTVVGERHPNHSLGATLPRKAGAGSKKRVPMGVVFNRSRSNPRTIADALVEAARRDSLEPDKTYFDRNDLDEEVTGQADTEAVELAFGETREEKKTRRIETDLLGSAVEQPGVSQSSKRPRFDNYGVAREAADWIRKAADAIGLKMPLTFVNLDNAEHVAAARRYSPDIPPAVWEDVLRRRNEGVKGHSFVSSQRGYIFISPSQMKRGGGHFVLAHELGHIIYRQASRELIDQHKGALTRLFEKSKDAVRQRGAGDGEHQYLGKNKADGLEEWFSDEFASWLIKESHAEKGLLARLFTQLKSFMRRVYRDMLNANDPRYRATSKEFDAFMRDVVARQAISNIPRAGKVARAFEGTPQSRQRRYLSATRNFLKDVPRMLPFVFTADRELRGMGEYGPILADMFSQQSSSKRHSAVAGVPYFQGLANARAIWNRQLDTVVERMGARRFKLALDELLAADDNSDPANLSRNARVLNDFLHKYREKYLVPRMGEFGELRVYAPRMYDLEQVQSRRDELANILIKHAGVLPENARGVVMDILEAGGSADFSFEESTNPMRPGFNGRFRRVLRGAGLNEALREAGFLQEASPEMLRNYIASSTKYAEFQRVAENDGRITLSRLLSLLPDQDRRRARKIIEGYMGRTGIDSDQRAVKAMSWVMVYESYLTLMFSAVASIPDLAGAVMRSRNFGDAKRALGSSIRALRDMGNTRERARLLGLLNERMTHQALKEAYGQSLASTKAQKATDRLFHWNGQEYLTNFSRVMSMAVAEEFLYSNAEKAQRGDRRARRYLEELNVDAEIVMEWHQNGRPVWGPDNNDTSAQLVSEAIYQFVDESVIRPNASQRPLWANHPMLMLLWHLKSFFWAYGKVVLGGMGREAVTRWNEAEGGALQKAGAASVPFAIGGLMLLPLAALARELREEIQYADEDDEPTNGDTFLEYWWGRFHDAGLFGPFELLSGATRFGGGVDDAAFSLAGPTFEHLHELSDGLTWADVKRSTPGVNQVPWLNEMVKERVAP